jgi:hypothetical protein
MLSSDDLTRSRDLRRNRARRRVADGGVAPQVTHHAPPRTLASGDQHRRHLRDRTVVSSFVFNE